MGVIRYDIIWHWCIGGGYVTPYVHPDFPPEIHRFTPQNQNPSPQRLPPLKAKNLLGRGEIKLGGAATTLPPRPTFSRTIRGHDGWINRPTRVEMVDGEAVDQLRGQSEDVMLGVRDTTTTHPLQGQLKNI